MDSTDYHKMFRGDDGEELTPLWPNPMLAAMPNGDSGSVMVDLLAAHRALTEPETGEVMPDGPFAGWHVVAAPQELPSGPAVLLSPDGHLVIRMDMAQALAQYWQRRSDGPGVL
jgi:hypothetical protein